MSAMHYTKKHKEAIPALKETTVHLGMNYEASEHWTAYSKTGGVLWEHKADKAISLTEKYINS